MTEYRQKILTALANHEYEGTIEVQLEVHGDYTGLYHHLVRKAYAWLDKEGYIEESYPRLTPKGEAFLKTQKPIEN